MTTEHILILLAGAACGGFVNGFAGFGTSLFALGWFLQVLPPAQAVAVTLVLSVASGIQGVIRVRRAINWRRLSWFLLPGLAGIPIGLQLLDLVDAWSLTLVIGVFMFGYGAFFILRRDLPSIARPTPGVDASIGFAGGILGALAGLGGALPTVWISMRDWPKEQARAVLQPYNLIVLGLSAVLLAFAGVYEREVLLSIAVALPSTMISAQIGLWAFGRLNDGAFRRVLVAMTLIGGVVVLGRALI